MAYCHRCGAQLSEGASFCHKCGTPAYSYAPAVTPKGQARPRAPVNLILVSVALSIAAVIVVGAIVAGGVPFLFGGIVGSGNIVTRQENYTGFTSLVISDGFRFTIIQSASYRVSLTVDDNLVQYVQFIQTGNQLSIGFVSGHSFTLASPQVTISMPDLSSLDISGGTSGSTSGFVSSHAFMVTASGGSRLTSSGSATDLTADASGGSQLDLSNLHVTNVEVSISGGSGVTVNPSGRVDGDISGGSQLFYLGNPTLGNIATSGFSSISRK